MAINLPREQQEWLEAQVKAGAYDEARASIARGEGMTLDEYRARITERLDSFRRQ
jgi:antitoxin ParD1/3/4